jgi:N-acetylmuramic acid 6-phosphate etherase
LPGTFGLERGIVRSRMAGGAASTDCAEDDVSLAEQDLANLAIEERDTVIAVAASGRTPYTLAMARAARGVGAAVLAVVNAPRTPLADLADVAIEVAVGAEVLRGSTRLSAGSAQKVAMDALTTAAMVRLGRVHGDLMIDVVAANAKLRARSAGNVAEITGCPTEIAARALDDCAGNARAAVLHLELGLSVASALAYAARHRSLRDALAARR